MSRLQGFVTKSLGVALPGFRKLYDLVCDCVSGWSNDPVSMLESHEGHLKRPGHGQCPDRTCGLASNAGSAWQAVWPEISYRKGKLANQWRIDAKSVRLSGECVSDISKRRSGIACPRCQTSMQEIMRIAPLRNEPALIAYECPACEIWPAARTTDRSDAP